VALLVIALGLSLYARRPGAPTVPSRLDLSRLSEGRLRQYVVQGTGYGRQFHALAETFPHPAGRAAIQQALPEVDRLLRAVYETCLVVQRHEFGEPSAGGGADGATDSAAVEAEATLREALDTLSRHYALLRGSWSTGRSEPALGESLLRDLPPLTARLRTVTRLLDPSAASRPLSAQG
jgi:hypothetical protein